MINEELKLWGTARPPSGDAIWIPRADSVRYAQVANVISRHLAGGGLYVFPLHNELYYFTGTSNPMRQLMAPLSSDEDLNPRTVLPRLAARGTEVVVILSVARASWPPVWTQLELALHAAYPCQDLVQGWAQVRWRPRGWIAAATPSASPPPGCR